MSPPQDLDHVGAATGGGGGNGNGLTDEQLRAAPIAVTIEGLDMSTADQGAPAAVNGAWPVRLSNGTTFIDLQAGLTDSELRASPVPVSTGGLTDGELRAAPVEVTGSVDAAVSGSVSISNFPAVQPVSGTVAVSNPTPQGLTDSQLRATPVPVSGTVTVSNPTAQGLTDSQLRATPVPVSTGGLTDSQLRATPVPVSGTITVSNPTAQGLTDSQLRATPVPVTVSNPTAQGLTDAQLRATPVPVKFAPAALYRLFVPASAAGASKVYFDLFNATGSGKTLRILSLVPVVSGAVAVTGTLAVDLFLTRTTAIGTGGTAATAEGTTLTAATISKMNPSDASLPAGVTARAVPGGGATPGAVLAWCSVFTEETSQAAYMSAMNDLARRNDVDFGGISVPENTGLRVVQGAVASVGNIGFDVVFTAE